MHAQNGESKSPFDTRAFVALSLVLGGVGLVATGVSNHLYQAEPMSARHVWMAAHNGLALLVVMLTTWHAALNWKSLKRHFRKSARRWGSAGRETVWATAVVALVLLVAVGHALH